jgi:PleD family two-component response regulator
MEKQFSKTVLAVVNDLFFSAKINEAAKRAGVTLKYVTTEKDLLEKAKADPALIIFDLNFEAVRPIEVIRKLKGTDELKHISLLRLPIARADRLAEAGARSGLRHGHATLGILDESESDFDAARGSRSLAELC